MGTPLLPATYKPNLAQLLPAQPALDSGPLLAWFLACTYLVLITARSLIHLLLPDGGAHSIATIDIAVAGGSNIVGLFGQWGASQLLLALLLWVLLLRYRGLVPLVLLVFLLEPALRSLAGHLKPIHTLGAAPGARWNWWVEPPLALCWWLSLCPARREPNEPGARHAGQAPDQHY